MGVLDGAAHRPEQGHPFPGPHSLRRAEVGDRLPLDVLHHQVGLAVLGRSAVEHRGDVRMLEARQDLSLLAEAPIEVLGVAPAPDQLQRDDLAERIVVAHGPVDRAHAAVRDGVEDLVGTDPLPAGIGPARVFGAAVGVEPGRPARGSRSPPRARPAGCRPRGAARRRLRTLRPGRRPAVPRRA